MAAPAEQSAELYNKLVKLDPESELPQIRQVVWQLRKLDRSGFDTRTRVAILSGLLLLGERVEADQIVESVLPHARSAGGPVQMALGWALLDMARVDDYSRIYKDLLSQPDGPQMEGVAHNAELGAFLSGDLDWLEDLGANDQLDSDTRRWAQRRLVAIRNAGLSDSFAAHQKVVNSIVGPFQTKASVSTGMSADEELQISCKRQVAGDKTVRHRLLGELREALVALYESLGYDDAVERMNVLGTAIVSHPAYLSAEGHAAA